MEDLFNNYLKHHFTHILTNSTSSEKVSNFVSYILKNCIPNEASNSYCYILTDKNEGDYESLESLGADVIHLDDEADTMANISEFIGMMNERFSLLERSNMSCINDYNDEYFSDDNEHKAPTYFIVIDDLTMLQSERVINLVYYIIARSIATNMYFIINASKASKNDIGEDIFDNCPIKVKLDNNDETLISLDENEALIQSKRFNDNTPFVIKY